MGKLGPNALRADARGKKATVFSRKALEEVESRLSLGGGLRMDGEEQ